MLFGLDLAKREIAKAARSSAEGYTDVMAMHLAGVPTAVASCGTAFGTEHVSVIRRLIGDDSFDLGEVIYTFDGDAAGQAAALKAFDGDQSFAAQTFVCVAPNGQDLCDLRLNAGDTAVRDLGREPTHEFAIRSILRDYDLDTAEGGVAALQRCPAGRAHQAGGAARRVRAPARRLDGLAGRVPRSSGGCASRRARPPSGRVVRVRPRRRRPATTCACTGSARRSSPRCRFPRSPARGYDELPEQRVHPPQLRPGAPRSRRRMECGGRSGRRGWRPWSPSARPTCAGWSASWPSSRSNCPARPPTRCAT